MSFTAIQWRWDPSQNVNDSSPPITIDLVRSIDGITRYAVRQAGACLNKRGQWEFEPMPSSRDDRFLNRCRYDSWRDAARAIVRHCKAEGRFSKEVSDERQV